MLPDKHTSKSLRLTQNVFHDVAEYENALQSDNKNPIAIPRDMPLASSTLVAKLQENRGKIVVKNGQPFMIASDPQKNLVSGIKTKKDALALRHYQNFLGDKIEQHKKTYKSSGQKRASSIMAGSQKASEIFIKEQTLGPPSGSMTPNMKMLYSEPASGYFNKPLSRDGAYTIRARVKSQMGGYKKTNPIGIKNGYKTQQNWKEAQQSSDINYASMGGGQTIYSGISEQSTHANMARKSKKEKVIKDDEIKAMFQMF